MTYIILAAGKGVGLYPLTLNYPKTMYKLDENTTVLQRMIKSIRHYDKNSEIVLVVGYLADTLKKEFADENIKIIENPFYEITNSISSLWFARNYLERENITILHGDVIFDDYLMENVISKPTDYPHVIVDKTFIKQGAYNVVTENNQVLVMSKQLETFNAKYCCCTKLDAVSSRLLKKEIDKMIYSNMYDQYFEDALVQMIMFLDFKLFSLDVDGHKWREIDTVDDLLKAQEIQKNSILK